VRSQDDVDKMVEHGVIAEVDRNKVKGHTKLFLTFEPEKGVCGRWRPIRHTEAANDYISKDDCAKIEMATKKDITHVLHEGEWMIQIDMKAYFDQFLLSDEVSHRFCFRYNGKYYRLLTLPMGLRPSVGVAGSVTARLLDFEKKSKSLSVIDNVAFFGSREDVLHDAQIFDQRVKSIGAQLNEDTSDLSKLLKQRDCFAGVEIDMHNKTMQLSQKSVKKTIFSWSRRATWTWRQFACHVGLLWWSCGILEVPVSEYYPLLRFISEVGRMMTEDDSRWEQRAVVWPSAWPCLERWTDLVLRNVPRVVPVRFENPEWLIATDASALGWGYVAYNTATGEARAYGGAWYADFVRHHGDKIGKSTFSEPKGILFSLVHLFKQFPSSTATTISLLTDNTVSEASFNKGYNSHSFDINETLRELHRRFPAHRIKFSYVPGPVNPADYFSRNPGKIASEEEREKAAADLRLVSGYERSL
jgi:hypothetical protein